VTNPNPTPPSPLPPPWEPSMPLRADATDEQIRLRLLEVGSRTTELAASRMYAVQVAREFASACVVADREMQPGRKFLEALDGCASPAPAPPAEPTFERERSEIFALARNIQCVSGEADPELSGVPWEVACARAGFIIGRRHSAPAPASPAVPDIGSSDLLPLSPEEQAVVENLRAYDPARIIIQSDEGRPLWIHTYRDIVYDEDETDDEPASPPASSAQ